MIAFASAGDICLAHSKNEKRAAHILSTIAAHSQHITCLKFATWMHEYPENIDFVITGDAGGSVAVHLVSLEDSSYHVQLLTQRPVPVQNRRSVTYCTGGIIKYSASDDVFSLITASSFPDSTLEVRWNCYSERNLSETNCASVSFGSAFALCAAFHAILDVIVIAVGTSDSRIEILCANISEKEVIKLLSLNVCTDWITAVSFKDFNDDILLASAGQDSLIRVWQFVVQGRDVVQKRSQEDFRWKMAIPSKEFGDRVTVLIELDAILSGHDGWVYSVEWHPNRKEILSSSMDKSFIVWEPSEGGQGVWLEKVRVGSVGGQAAGFYGGCFSPDGSVILGNSYFGGFFAWHLQQGAHDIWLPEAVFGGHSMAVCDLAWDPSGSYLLSCSLDQTTRCFAPVHTSEDDYGEIARPQVHGHELSCIASISSSCFLSGAEEKIFRAFRAPRIFAHSIANISGRSYEKLFKDNCCLAEHGAALPALGLSNKEISDSCVGDSRMTGGTKEERASLVSNPAVLEEVPTEDFLMQNTLWPEIRKLYGHGFEVFCVASNHAGTLVATACKASHPEHAVVMLWDTKEWHRRADLFGHRLTVTQLEFSPDDSMLLCVSRDRTFSVFVHTSEGEHDWKKMSNKTGGQHSRIIWTCSWSSDSKFFATGARDMKLALWAVALERSGVTHVAEMKRKTAITAVSFAPELVRNEYLLAVGVESGEIEVLQWDPKSGEFTSTFSLCRSAAHSQTVRRLSFRPVKGIWSSKLDPNGRDIFEFASAGNDNAVKVHRLSFSLST